uniref:Putative lipid A core: surface polymer ligase WaaL n=1 Tax=Edwardsiella tarda TaxID=636 RepID=Q93F46_EDWTA|nr:putative lipid A core: surface polymer ligase WaaL [Edwardsiella tarda]
MKTNFIDKLPIYISALFCAFISLLSISDDNNIVSNIYYVSFALFIVWCIRERKNIFNKTSLLLGAFLLLSAISTYWSDHSKDTSRYIQHAVYIFIFSSIIYELRGTLFFKNILFKSYVATCSIFVIINGFLFYSKYNLYDRFYPILGPSNTIDYAGILCLAIIFCCYLYQHEKNKAPYVIAGIILLAGVILSQSRTPIIALAISLMVLFIKSKRSAIISLVTILAITFIIHTVYPSIFTRDAVNGAPTPRIFTWLYTIQQVSEHHPWLGFGYNDTFAHYFKPRNFTYNNAHSVFMSILYYSGIIGVILFFSYILNIFFAAIKVFNENRYPIAFILIPLIFSSTQGYLYIYHPREIWLVLWLPLFLAIPMSKISSEQV